MPTGRCYWMCSWKSQGMLGASPRPLLGSQVGLYSHTQTVQSTGTPAEEYNNNPCIRQLRRQYNPRVTRTA
jgi:hypothetical protein